MIPCCLAPPLMPRLPLSPSVCTCPGTHIAGCFPLEPAEHKQESWWGTGYLLSHLQGKEEKVKMTRFPDWYTQIIWLCKSDKTAKDKKLSCFRQIFLLDYFKKRHMCIFLRNYFTWILIGIWDPSRLATWYKKIELSPQMPSNFRWSFSMGRGTAETLVFSIPCMTVLSTGQSIGVCLYKAHWPCKEGFLANVVTKDDVIHHCVLSCWPHSWSQTESWDKTLRSSKQ